MSICLRAILSSAFLTLVASCAIVGGMPPQTFSTPLPPGAFDVRRSVGASAGDLLADTRFRKLRVEIQAVRGLTPLTSTRTRLQSFLEERLNKPDYIELVIDAEIASPGLATLTDGDLVSLEREHRSLLPQGEELTLYLLFVDGSSADTSASRTVLGKAYRNTSLAIFESGVRALAGGTMQPPLVTLETTVLLHELGHLLGLVNEGTPAQWAHEDQSNPHHCTDSHCLMSPDTDTDAVISRISGGMVPTLDANCLLDLADFGGR